MMDVLLRAIGEFIETNGVAVFLSIMYAYLTLKTVAYMREKDAAIATQRQLDTEQQGRETDQQNKLIDNLIKLTTAVERISKTDSDNNNRNMAIVEAQTEQVQANTDTIKVLQSIIERIETLVSNLPKVVQEQSASITSNQTSLLQDILSEVKSLKTALGILSAQHKKRATQETPVIETTAQRPKTKVSDAQELKDKSNKEKNS